MAYFTNALSAARGSGLSAEKLKNEYDFLKYISMLKGFAQRYCVMIAASDTPYGPTFTREMLRSLMDIGLEVNLYGKYRCAYAALIDGGKLIFEQIQPDAPENPKGIIKINGKNYSQNLRGLNFVVYDKVTKSVIDSVNFDVFSDTVSGNRPLEAKNDIRKFCEKHPEVSVICFNRPKFPEKPLTLGEKFIIENNIKYGQQIILKNLNKHVFTLNQYFDEEGLVEVLSTPKSYHDVRGVRHFEDQHGRYVNILGGHRVTTYQPEQHCRTVYLVGGCMVFGVGTDDNRTIASYLQKLLNQNIPECKVTVQNYGFYLCEADRRSNEQMVILNALPVKTGDIVLYNLREDVIFDGSKC